MTDAVRLVIHTYKYLEKYWNIPIFPEHARKQSKMLCWMGNRTITSGFALRPWLPFYAQHKDMWARAVGVDAVHLPSCTKLTTDVENIWPEGAVKLSHEESFKNFRSLYR